MPVNSRQKGKRVELELVHILKRHGFDARRTQQYNGAVEDGQMDVESSGPLDRWEVKGVERLSPGIHDVVARAVAEAGGLPTAVAWKRNHKGWIACLSLETLLELLTELETFRRNTKPCSSA